MTQWCGQVILTLTSPATTFSRTVQDSVSSINLTPVWQNFVIDFTCTYESEGVTYVSLLDHFFVSEVLLQSVSEAGVLHHPDNSSDHEPIYCVLESLALSQSVTEKAPYKPKPSWRMASKEQKEQYKYLLDTRLSSIIVPTQVTECVDVH